MFSMLTFFQRNRYISGTLLIAGVAGVLFIGYGKFAVATSDVEALLIASGLSGSVIAQNLKHNDEKIASNRFLDFPQKIDISRNTYSIADTARGVSVSAGGESYFYPFETMAPYEVVNDIIAGQPILIAYCTVCETAVIVDRVIDGKEYFFEATDDLWEGSLIMVDRGDNPRLWVQASGLEITAGEAVALNFLPFDISSFAQYRTKHPAGKIVIQQ